MKNITLIHETYCLEQYERKRFLPISCRYCGKEKEKLYDSPESSLPGQICPKCLIQALLHTCPDILKDFLEEHIDEIEEVFDQYYPVVIQQDTSEKEEFFSWPL